MQVTDRKKDILGRVTLVLTTLIWGTSFIIMKDTLDTVPTLWLLAFRFTGAAVLMALFGVRQLKMLDRGYLKGGVVMGVFLCAAYIVQTYGLVYTTPGKNAFLTATYCVLVPFLWWFFNKKKPDGYNISAALICLIGMGFVSLQDDLSVGIGDALTCCCGLFYALHIIATAKAAEGRSPILLSMIQFATAAVLCWIAAPLSGPMPKSIPAESWYSIAYLCVMCTGVCFLLQTIGQKYTPPSAAAVILTLESVFGTLLSILFYHERLTLRVAAGFVLIFAAVLISETKLSFLRRGRGVSKESMP